MKALTTEQQALAEQHHGLIRQLVNERLRRCPAHVERGDFTGAAALALTKAAGSYDPGRGVPFEVFAASRIRWAIADAQREADPMGRAARSRAKAGVARDNDARREISLDDASLEVDQTMRGAGHRSAEMMDLALAIRRLPAIERQVLALAFVQELPQADVGRMLGVSASRVSQIALAGVERLRQMLLGPDAWVRLMEHLEVQKQTKGGRIIWPSVARSPKLRGGVK
jgi:RNA polymerase sigma factor for flagellar operon FliA